MILRCFFLEFSRIMSTILYLKHILVERKKKQADGPGDMIKIATMPIYDISVTKNQSYLIKSFYACLNTKCIM